MAQLVKTLYFKHPTANSVTVVGRFNNWSTTSHPMKRCGRTQWRLDVLLGTDDPQDLCFMVYESPADGRALLTSSIVRATIPPGPLDFPSAP